MADIPVEGSINNQGNPEFTARTDVPASSDYAATDQLAAMFDQNPNRTIPTVTDFDAKLTTGDIDALESMIYAGANITIDQFDDNGTIKLRITATGTGGSTTFIALTDTPTGYPTTPPAGDYYVQVNTARDGLVFTDVAPGAGGIPDTPDSEPKVRINGAWIEGTDAQPFVKIQTAPLTPIEGEATQYTCLFNDKETGSNYPGNVVWRDFNNNIIGVGSSTFLTFSAQGAQSLTCEFAITDSYERSVKASETIQIDVQQPPGFNATITAPNSVETDSDLTVLVRDDDIEQLTTSITITLNNTTKALTQNYPLPRINTTSFEDTIDLSLSTINAEPGDNIQIEYLEPRDENNDPRLVTRDVSVTNIFGATGVISLPQQVFLSSPILNILIYDDLATTLTQVNLEVISNGVVTDTTTVTVNPISGEDGFEGATDLSILTISDGDMVRVYYADPRDSKGVSRVIENFTYYSSEQNLDYVTWNTHSYSFSSVNRKGVLIPDSPGGVNNWSKVKWVKDPSTPAQKALIISNTKIPNGKWAFEIQWQDGGANPSASVAAGIGTIEGTLSSYLVNAVGNEGAGNYMASIAMNVYKPKALIEVERFGDNYDVTIFGERIADDVQVALETKSFTKTNASVFVKSSMFYENELTASEHFLTLIGDTAQMTMQVTERFAGLKEANPFAINKSKHTTGVLLDNTLSPLSDVDFTLNLTPFTQSLNPSELQNIILSGSIPFPMGHCFVSDLGNAIITDDQDVEVPSVFNTNLVWQSLGDDEDYDGSLKNVEFWIQIDGQGVVSKDFKLKFNQTRNLTLPSQGAIGDDYVDVSLGDNPTQWDAFRQIKEPRAYVTQDTSYLRNCLFMWQQFRPDYPSNESIDQVTETFFYYDAEALEWVDYPENMWSWFTKNIDGSAEDTRRGNWLYQTQMALLRQYLVTGELRWVRSLQRMTYYYISLTLEEDGRHKDSDWTDFKYKYSETIIENARLFGLTTAAETRLQNMFDACRDRYEVEYIFGDGNNKTITERQLSYALRIYMDELSYNPYDSVKSEKIARYFNNLLKMQETDNWSYWEYSGAHNHEGSSTQESADPPGQISAAWCPWQQVIMAQTIQRYFLISRDKRALESIARIGDALIRYGIAEDVDAFFASQPTRVIALNANYVGDKTFSSQPSGAEDDAWNVFGCICTMNKAAYAKSLLGDDPRSVTAYDGTTKLFDQLVEGVFTYRFLDYLGSRRDSRLANPAEDRPAWAIDQTTRLLNTYTLEGLDCYYLGETLRVDVDIDPKVFTLQNPSTKVEFESAVDINALNYVISSSEDMQVGATLTTKTAPLKGVLSYNNYIVTYTANSSESGIDSFEVDVTGASGSIGSFSVNVEILPSPNSPYIQSTSETVVIDQPLTIDLSQYVSGGVGGIDVTTATIVDDATNGALDTTNLNTTLEVIYTPLLSYTGPDLFTWSIQDNDSPPKNTSNTGMVSLDVTDANQPIVEVNNNPLTASVGARTVISQADLEYTSANNTPAEITYTIDTNDANVEIYNNNVLVPDTGTFTQADINAGLVETEGLNVSPMFSIACTVTDVGVPQNSLGINITGNVTQAGVIFVDEFTQAGDGSASGDLVINESYNVNSRWTIARGGPALPISNLQVNAGEVLGGASGNVRDLAFCNVFSPMEYEVDLSTIDTSDLTVSSDYIFLGCVATDGHDASGWSNPYGSTRARFVYLLPSAFNWLSVYDGPIGAGGVQISDVKNDSTAAGLTLVRDPRFVSDLANLKADMLVSSFWFVKKAQSIEFYYDNGTDGKTLLFSLSNDVAGGFEFDIPESRFAMNWIKATCTLQRIQIDEI